MTTKPYIHRVNYYETDKMGITHHSNYIRFMEEARVDWMDQMGYGFDRMEADGVLSPVLSVNCSYRHTTKFKDEIAIEVKMTGVSALKFHFEYVMKVGDVVVCTGESAHCMLENGKPVKVMERYPQLFADFVDSAK